MKMKMKKLLCGALCVLSYNSFGFVLDDIPVPVLDYDEINVDSSSYLPHSSTSRSYGYIDYPWAGYPIKFKTKIKGTFHKDEIRVECESLRNEKQVCYIPNDVKKIKLTKRFSNAKCNIYNDSLKYTQGAIVVDKGCRARFTVYLNKAIKYKTISCESKWHGEAWGAPTTCKIGGVGPVWKEDRYSKAGCDTPLKIDSPVRDEHGDDNDFGLWFHDTVDHNGIILDYGCRGRFAQEVQ